jgi:hypothetical protein
MLEVIRNHDYHQSRFLRGATIDASNLEDAHGAEATADASRVRCMHSERATVHFPPASQSTLIRPSRRFAQVLRSRRSRERGAG